VGSPGRRGPARHAVPYTLFALAQEQLPSSTAGVINTTTPLWTLLCEVAFGRSSMLVAVGLGCWPA
jgi:drug/metabolite transporter (DMT)-like permease